MAEPAPALLELHDVQVHFPVRRSGWNTAAAVVRAVDGVSLRLHAGEVLGLVGESGCGKSTLARAILQLVPPTAGRVLLGGRDLVTAAPAELQAARRELQMVFQDPHASLNPRLTIGDALSEPLRVHRLCPPEEVPTRVAELLRRVGLDPRVQRKYPHEFSGGQRQRIAIARALAVGARLLIADEPISALDVSIQAQIINLFAELVREMQLGLLFIAHDLSVVRHLSDRVAVMYLGRIVEVGPAEAVIAAPRHPYTRALVQAVPQPDPTTERTRRRQPMPGEPPSPLQPPSGCAFHPRCPYALPACQAAVSHLRSLPGEESRAAACVRLGEI